MIVTQNHLPSNGLTLYDLAAVSGLTTDQLKRWSVTDQHVGGLPVVKFVYQDVNGTEIGARFRSAIAGPGSSRWRKDTRPSLYGLPSLQQARTTGAVAITGDELSALVLRNAGVDSVAVPDDYRWDDTHDSSRFDDIQTVYLIKVGPQQIKILSKSRLLDQLQLVSISDTDLIALHRDDPTGFAKHWRELTSRANPAAAIRQQRQDQKRDEAYRVAQPLLHDPDLLDRYAEVFAAAGYAGDPRVPQLINIAITSRHLAEPMKIVCVAPSSAGKSFSVDIALPLHPKHAVYRVSAASPYALVYSQEQFTHRIIVFAEADSIPENGPAASALRSLISDSQLIYDHVATDASGQRATQRIVKDGPTGLIATSTGSLPEQQATRTLEVSLRDDPEQTKAILAVHARRAAGIQATQSRDLSRFIALQRYLELTRPHHVVIPYAEALASLVPDGLGVRARRDFPQLLTCIKTIALLHCCQRQRTTDGAIIAEISDYAYARDLLGTVYESVAAGGVTDVILDTVKAINIGETVSLTELARRLGIVKSTASWRVGRAIAAGLLVNGETRRNHEMKLSRSAALPGAVEVLPDPDRVWEVYETSLGEVAIPASRTNTDVPDGTPERDQDQFLDV